MLLRSGDGLQTPYVYAASWWNSTTVDEYLKDKAQPIWVSLSQGHVELYREIQQVYCGHSQQLEKLLNCQGPFWGRQYFFWHNGAPLTLIYEVFSNKLEAYLGQLPAALTGAHAFNGYGGVGVTGDGQAQPQRQVE